MNELFFNILATSKIPTEGPSIQVILWYLAGIILFLYFNAMFVASEFSLVQVRDSQLKEVSESQKKLAKKALTFKRQLDGYLSATQLGITISSIVLGMLGEPLVFKLVAPPLSHIGLPDKVVHITSFTLAMFIFTLLHVVLGELVPKSLAIRKPVRTILGCTRFLYIFYKCNYGFLNVLNKITDWILLVFFKVPNHGYERAHSSRELAHLVAESEEQQELTEMESRILHKTLKLNDRTVRDIMVPKSEVMTINIESPLEHSIELVTKQEHTRYPLVRGHLDNSLGFVHVKDILRLANEKREIHFQKIAHPLRVVSEMMPLDALLNFMLNHKTQLALAVDEFGNTTGLVFLTSVMEELVGDDIQDEFDNNEEEITKLKNGEYLVAGSASLEEVEEALGNIALMSSEVSTIGGYITQTLEKLPDIGDQVEIQNYSVIVNGTDGKKVTQLQFSPIGLPED